MKKNLRTRQTTLPPSDPTSNEVSPQETIFESIASSCSVLVVGLFILTFLAQNFVIPSGSMENTLLIGDHLVVDRNTLAPPSNWLPFVHSREPRRRDVVVFIKPVADPDPTDGSPTHLILVKRLIGVPGDRIHLHNGVVFVNGIAQSEPYALPTTADSDQHFLDEFPSVPPDPQRSDMIPEEWAVDFPNHIVNGELVVPPSEYFVMGDNRGHSADSRFWGFVPRENFVGRPLFCYWSFKATEQDLEKPDLAHKLAWIGHVVFHFFTDTRWGRTFHAVR